MKNLVRKLCKKPRCRYIRYMTPRMSPLPLIRLDNPEAWSNVGVDYLGPIMCKAECGGGGTNPCPNTANVKVWVSLFTCLHSRAIHCEIVRDCSAPAFLLAFRRFVALKNKPNCFYSDNALTFKSADKKLKALLGKGMDPIYNYAYYETAPVQWEFSTATAPWTNGVTERMVGIFKKQFKIVMQKRICTITEMEVIIMEIVSFVNERPLGETNINDEDIPITPNMLATGRPMRQLRTPSTAIMERIDPDKMWLERKRTLNHFWDKWQADYLATLSIDKKWLGDDTKIKPGDVVILKPESMEKNQWRLARILNIHKTKDGEYDSASIRLPSGSVVTRSVKQLALLEPCAIELERQWQEQKSVQSLDPEVPLTRGVRSVGEHVESEPAVVRPTPMASRSRSSTRPYPKTDAPQSKNAQPGEASATAADPEPASPEVTEATAEPSDGNRRSKRARHRSGYYTDLLKGKK